MKHQYEQLVPPMDERTVPKMYRDDIDFAETYEQAFNDCRHLFLERLPAQSSRPTVDKVREFHEAFGHPVVDDWRGGFYHDAVMRVLRVKLIAEELGELCQALGVDLLLHAGPNVEIRLHAEVVREEVDICEAADALGDLDYVVAGANLVFGFPAEKVLDEIHRSNMSKLGADGRPIYREDGKILKGPNYSPPQLVPILFGEGKPQ